jgi:hypothetical protein
LTTAPLLLPNLGAEEGSDWRRTLREPRIAAAARLWRFLFSTRARVVGSTEGAVPIRWDEWPASLEGGRDHAAFEWLEELEGCVPWLADESAREDLDEAGAAVAGPSARIVERVHDKAFALQVAEAEGLVPRILRGTSRVFEPAALGDPESALAEIRRQVGDWPATLGERFTLKPRRGTSGRGRFDGTRADLAVPAGPDGFRAALPRLAARGGAILEPWLERTSDLSAQVLVQPDSGVLLLGSLEAFVSRSGTWRGHRGEVDSSGRIFSGHREDESLREAAGLVAAAAASAGFFGPASLDALTFRLGEDDDKDDDGDSREHLRPVVELNARFSMGTVTLGLVRRVLPTVREALGLSPGERRGFAFWLDEPRIGWEGAREFAGADALIVPLWREGDPVRPGFVFTLEPGSLDGVPWHGAAS